MFGDVRSEESDKTAPRINLSVNVRLKRLKTVGLGKTHIKKPLDVTRPDATKNRYLHYPTHKTGHYVT